MLSNKFPANRKKDIVVQELKGEVLIYDLKVNKAFCLNETSAAVWHLCDGTKSVVEIAELLTGQTKNPFSEDLVWLAIDQLKRENLIENSQEFRTKFAGLSRREVIKKVGMASLVALPVISSLVAPMAVNAQSNLAPVGGACQNPNNCRPCTNGNTVQCRNNNAVCPTGTSKCCDCSS